MAVIPRPHMDAGYVALALACGLTRTEAHEIATYLSGEHLIDTSDADTLLEAAASALGIPLRVPWRIIGHFTPSELPSRGQWINSRVVTEVPVIDTRDLTSTSKIGERRLLVGVLDGAWPDHGTVRTETGKRQMTDVRMEIHADGSLSPVTE